MAEQIHTINEFRGLREYETPGTTPGFTRKLDNVVARYNRLFGRGGIQVMGDSPAASAHIVGLMAWASGGEGARILRVLPSAIEKFNPLNEDWEDVTGTAFTILDDTFIQSLMHKNTLCFTMDGQVRPRKITTGNSAVLGGTPPFAKTLAQNFNYLFLFNVSTDGLTFLPRQGVYSELFDFSWTGCSGQEINLNETSGDILLSQDFGEWVIVFKTDAVMQIGFLGGEVIFSQRPLPFDKGLIARASAAKVAELGIVFLDTALKLDRTDGQTVIPLPPFVQHTLDNVLVDVAVDRCVGVNYPDADTYSLFYPHAAADSGLRGRISYNFRTGEFTHAHYASHEFYAAMAFKYGAASRNILVGSTSDKVYLLDYEVSGDDNSRVDRYWTTDWLDYGFHGEKVFKGATFEVRRTPGARVSVSVASDRDDNFFFEKFYSLSHLKSRGDFVTVPYRLDSGLRGSVFNVKIRLHPDRGVSPELVPPLKLHWEPVAADMGSNLSVSPQPMKVD